MAGVLYCEQTNVESVLSEAGVRNRVDDLFVGTGDTGLLTDCIDQASSDIDIDMLARYPVEELQKSRWIKWSCAWLAAGYLMIRRGLSISQSTKDKIDEIKMKLARIRDGYDRIPEIAERGDRLPSILGITHDKRFRQQPSRMEPQTSSKDLRPRIAVPTDFESTGGSTGYVIFPN